MRLAYVNPGQKCNKCGKVLKQCDQCGKLIGDYELPLALRFTNRLSEKVYNYVFCSTECSTKWQETTEESLGINKKESNLIIFTE